VRERESGRVGDEENWKNISHLPLSHSPALPLPLPLWLIEFNDE
jgi:hypothetical protein